MEKIALILIYFTLFSSYLLSSTLFVYFYNVQAYFNPYNPQLAG